MVVEHVQIEFQGDDNMIQEQKDNILELLKCAYEKRNFSHHYLIPYKEFFDTDEMFTDFNCERSLGKLQYISLIEKIIDKDKEAQVYVEIYGFETQCDDIWIYADTLIVLSVLSFEEIQEILNESSDLFPSDIGEMDDMTEEYTLIKDGCQCPAKEHLNKSSNIYYCWWD